MTLRQFLKVTVILALGMYGLWGAFDIRRLWLFDGANLLFHEAGHVLFSFLGEFVGIMGGTFLQLAIPAGLAVAFFRKRQIYSACVMLFWYGENYFGIAHYIQDARSQVLPLIGGEIHDWGYILERLHLLPYDQGIGGAVWCMGLMTILAAVCGGVYFSKKE